MPVNPKEVVFYGAGSYAAEHIDLWKKEWNVICFVDKDAAKWGTTIGGIVVRSLEEVMGDYPNVDFVITTATRFKDIYNYLCKRGIREERISFVVPREKRLGCSFLGKWFQLDGGKVIKTCCYEQGFKQKINDSFGTEYELFIQNVGAINKKLSRREQTSCDGCCMLVEDWWEIAPKVQCFSLATGFKGDACNCRCIYCDAKQLLESSNDTGNLSALEVCEYFASRDDFDGIEIAINNGEFVVNRDQKAILEICRKKKWHMTLYTNGTRISDDVLDYMKEYKTTVICSLDAGTKETFKKIKCVDGFEKAVNNLKVYSEWGTVVLKYIVIKNCNDNMADIEGFINIARDVAHKVVLSRDLYMIKDSFSDNEREIYRFLVDELRNKSAIPVVISEDCIPETEIDWIRKILEGK